MTSLLVFGIGLGLLAQAPAPSAQVSLRRADAHVVLGWQNLHKEQPQDHYNDWLNGIFYAGAGAGWLWNDHLRTQVDFGAGTSAEQYRFRQYNEGTNQVYETSRVSVQQQSVAIAQQYQFFRNRWFHPRVAGGVEIARETTRTEYQPTSIYDTVTRTSRIIMPAHDEGPDHHLIARPFGEVGFKAYTTRNTFFTGDMRLMFRSGIDEVLFRAGFGIDF
jgi:hypothetical protein